MTKSIKASNKYADCKIIWKKSVIGTVTGQ